MTAASAQLEGAAPRRRPSVSRKVSPALFVAILIAFALPFGAVSCEGPPVKFTGYELATWRVQQTTPPATTDDGEDLPAKIEHQASAFALFMLLSAAVGLGLGLAGRRGAGFAVASGLSAAMALLIRALDTAGAEPRRGFGIASLTFLILGVWHAILAIRRMDSTPPGSVAGLPPGAVPLGRPSAPVD